MEIDFSQSFTADEVTAQQNLGTDKSSTVKTLTALHEAVKSGNAEYGKFYKVGQYKNSSGARTAIRNCETKFADRIPALFDLEPVIKPDPDDANKRVSYLFAAVAEDQREIDEANAAKADDEPEDDGTDVADEPNAAPRGKRAGK